MISSDEKELGLIKAACEKAMRRWSRLDSTYDSLGCAAELSLIISHPELIHVLEKNHGPDTGKQQ